MRRGAQAVAGAPTLGKSPPWIMKSWDEGAVGRGGVSGTWLVGNSSIRDVLMAPHLDHAVEGAVLVSQRRGSFSVDAGGAVIGCGCALSCSHPLQGYKILST